MSAVSQLGKYQPYPEYKDSGVEWLGEIPSEWNLVALKHALKTSVTDGPHETPAFIDKGVPFMSVDSIQDNKLVFDGCRYISEDDHERYSKKCLPEQGDILLGKAASVGKVAHVTTNTTFNVWSPLAVIRVDKNNHNSRFFYYCFQSKPIQYQCQIKSNANTQANLGMGDISNLEFVIPPITAQIHIATFLDNETARIDKLIAKQQQLIELLKEKRQAVISHAVTKGLNPNAPMKDSGVAWLGQVPEHWVVMKFNHCANIRNGQVDPTVKPYKDYLLIAPNHIESGTGRLLELQTAEEQGADSGKYLCKKGEVIYSKIRPALAKACISPSDDVICSADMYPINGTLVLENNFLIWFLLSDCFTRFAVNQADRVAMPKINRDALSECRIPIPPIEEQKEIISTIVYKTEKLDQLIGTANKAIQLLQERRTALISAAVTGKIDLRGWKAPLNEVAA